MSLRRKQVEKGKLFERIGRKVMGLNLSLLDMTAKLPNF